MERLWVENWTVDYGHGPEPITVPHAWRQDVPVAWEGPAFYRATLEVPRGPSTLRFHGVSYEAQVSIAGKPVAAHRGIWDSFDVPLADYAGQRVDVEVRVVKNGGPTFPVSEVASGFLPYVFHTFGGIFREVEWVLPESSTQGPRHESAVRVDGRRIYWEERPFYPRGILHWGWYPDRGAPHPSDSDIQAEVRALRALGFNLVKFCLWVPPHRYLEILAEHEMAAWMELPVWNPSPDRISEIGDELERIVGQYRGHPNILAWTIGCELGKSMPADERRRLVGMVQNDAGSRLVKDSSGGAEMYGGDLREFGDFEDYHPYSEASFFPAVLDCLRPISSPNRPVLLGEFNDADCHRDLAHLAKEMPYWASSMAELNAPGVRWLHALPDVLAQSRFALRPHDHDHRGLVESSRSQAAFVRKIVQEAVRVRDDFSGYVVTGLRDTPISSSGIFTDFGEARFSPDELSWNQPSALVRFPIRRPPWVRGGNRPGWLDLSNWFEGQVLFRIGIHSELGVQGSLIWSIESGAGMVVRGVGEPTSVPALTTTPVGEISVDLDPGAYRLRARFGEAREEWRFNVFARPTSDELEAWRGAVSGGRIELRERDGVVPCPFWRESAYEFAGDAWGLSRAWERLLAISPDCGLDAATLEGGYEVVVNRIDLRSYEEHPIAVRYGDRIVTTLRPQGGLGIQPVGIENNPSGCELMRRLMIP